MTNGSSIWDLLTIIVVLGVVFWLAWFVTRFVAVRSKGKAAGRFMRVVDRLAISNDKAILLVKIGSEYHVIGIAGHEMRLIGKLDEEQARAFEEEMPSAAKTGAPGDMWKGMQSFGARLGMAMRGRTPPPGQPKPEEPKKTDDQSVLDMMNERIKLRKETKRW